MKRTYHIVFLVSIVLAGCIGGRENSSLYGENEEAKELLQGVWVNEDEEVPSLMAEGDSIFFPDTTSMPAKFWVRNDSLYIEGNNTNRYKITALSEQMFKLRNQNNEEIKLVRDGGRRFLKEFRRRRPYAMNIFRVYDEDTVSTGGETRFACSVHIEPTSERVIKSSYNDDGIEVDNLYLDNVARLRVLVSGVEIYSHSFRKQEFAAYIPREFMAKSIMRELRYSRSDGNAVYLDAVIGIPDASTCYVVELKVGRDGKLTKKLK